MTLDEILRLAETGTDMPLGRLVRGTPAAEACERLRAATSADLLGAVKNEQAARSVLAGAWVAADGFEEAHTIAQELEGEWGDWWHAILHRREPDFGNAMYWYRRVKPPKVVAADLGTRVLAIVGAAPGPELRPLAEAIRAAGRWEPGPFVNACEAARAGRLGSGDAAALVAIQRREWRSLFDHCRAAATGG